MSILLLLSNYCGYRNNVSYITVIIRFLFIIILFIIIIIIIIYHIGVCSY